MDPLKDTSQNVFSGLLAPSIQTNPFGANRSGERAYRRAERIAAAIILLTNHMREDDMLRVQARQSALSILPQILSLRDEMRSLTSQKMTEVLASIRHLISLLKMMVFGSHISSQNAEVTIAALEELSTLISLSTRSALTDTIRFGKEDFLDVRDDYKGHIKDIRDRASVKDSTAKKDSHKDGAIRTPPVQSAQQDLSARSQGIITILRSGGELMMPEIAAHLPEYGEKTIQRELNRLIAEGRVKRTGSRRWSRYSAI